ncbi:MAG: amino acid ABC transporter ATP-binding protein [Planctomycetes bacterium]|nr:amino acid ABC transporter ATP-binding protein [Planctomycetota bacterium]
MSHAIRIDNLTKRFHSRTILEKVSLEIQPGETVALIGPSGGGKSTLLRCINGLNPFEEGSVRVGDWQLTPRTPAQVLAGVRRVVGMIFQDFQLFPHMTALENVMEAPRQVLRQSTAEARRRGLDLLRRVGLEQRAHDYPRQLSGGQKQRVAIARALAMEPECLLCDEITSALDPELKAEVLTTLEQLRAEGMTLILVTHEMHFARRAADRVFVLAEGRIIEHGRPQELFAAPAEERTRRFLSRVME